MPNVEFFFPILGLNKGEAVSRQPPLTSGYMNNVRPYDVLETRRRGGQRPGLEKRYTQQIRSTKPIVKILELTVMVT